MCFGCYSSCVIFIVILTITKHIRKQKKACRPAKLTVFLSLDESKFVNLVASWQSVCEKSEKKTERDFQFFLLFPLLRRAYRNQLIPKITQRHRNFFTPFSDEKCKGSAANLIYIKKDKTQPHSFSLFNKKKETRGKKRKKPKTAEA